MDAVKAFNAEVNISTILTADTVPGSIRNMHNLVVLFGFCSRRGGGIVFSGGFAGIDVVFLWF